MLYNGMDERIQVVTTPAIGAADTRVYLYDLDHRIVGEYGATGTSDIKAEYIWLMPEVGATGPTGGDDGLGGYMPLATAVGQAGALNWLHTHHHGAPILTTNAAGTIVPYPAHAVLGFPGQFANSQQLAGAQNYYNRYRDYDVNTGRYIQADPIGLAGDDNPYAYAGGNPLRYVDPSGEVAWGLVFAGGDLAWQLYKNQGKIKCVNWFSVGSNLLGGGVLNAVGKGALRFKTAGSFTWDASRKWMNKNGIHTLRIGQQRHHWLFERNQGLGKYVPDYLKNQPWNIKPISSGFNNWLSRHPSLAWLGAPTWAGEIVGGGALMSGGMLMGSGGDNGCSCK